MQVHLVDATYELFRAYFGVPAEAPGEAAAVRGLIETTLLLLRDPGVTHVAAATDHVIRSFRNDLFDGYKTEEGVPPDLLAQFPVAERALRALGVVVWPMVEFEADDALAAGAARYADQVERVVLATPDKDLAQCVITDRVVMWDRRRNITLDAAGVQGKYGVMPESIPDWLALVGDSADGYPGLPGWGAKSAAGVLQHYGHIEDIPAEASRWQVSVRGAARLAETLQAQREDALLYRRLATLRRDVPLTESLDDLRWRGAHREPFVALCDELGFRTTRDRPHRWADD